MPHHSFYFFSQSKKSSSLDLKHSVNARQRPFFDSFCDRFLELHLTTDLDLNDLSRPTQSLPRVPLQILQTHNLQCSLARRIQIHLRSSIRSHLLDRLRKLESRQAHLLSRFVAFVRWIVAVFGLQEGVRKDSGDGVVHGILGVAAAVAVFVETFAFCEEGEGAAVDCVSDNVSYAIWSEYEVEGAYHSSRAGVLVSRP